MTSGIVTAYFRKSGHTCSMNKKEHILVNIGQFEVEILLKSANLKFLKEENTKKILKGHCVWVPHQISV